MPFLVLGNKIDLGNAPSEEDLRYQLGLYETYGKEVSTLSINAALVLALVAHPYYLSGCLLTLLLSLCCSLPLLQPRGERNPSIRPIELYMCSVVRKMGYGDGKSSPQTCCAVAAL